MKRAAVLSALTLACGCAPVSAQEAELHGFLDLRAVAAPESRSFIEGGEGRLRYGGDDNGLEFGGAALIGRAQLTPAWLAFGQLQLQEHADGMRADVVEAYVRWRPVSTTQGRWSLQLGAFFPPISQENDAIGWTSRWTITPSAINSWVGEELRTIGAQVRHEWRSEAHTLAATVALYARNDPAGEILFARGWSLSDLSCGLGCRLREPDTIAIALEEPVPRRYDPYVEIDDRIGAYAGLDWEASGRGKLALLYYNNNADGSTDVHYDHSEIYTWETRFWSLGGETVVGDVVLLAQAMHGDTYFNPSPFFQSEAEFNAGYVLAGWNRGDWRPALRLDWFHTREHPSVGEGGGEHGSALTVALNWRPREWLRVTGELLRIEGARDVPRATERTRSLDGTQFMLNARLLF